MKYMKNRALAPVLACSAAIVLIANLSACSSAHERPKPAELSSDAPLMAPRLAWSTSVGRIEQPLEVGVHAGTVHVTASDGTVVAIDARTGREIWRGSAGGPAATGAGGDGRLAALVNRGNDLVTLDGGRELWRQRLPAQAYTAPLVAGGRVFVLGADRAVTAWDGQTGRLLWTQKRPGEPLVLRQSGVILAVGDTLVVGLSGRLVGLNPSNGSVRWEAPVASPRGVNDVERLVDLVGRADRQGDVVCARAFQASVGCVNAARGALLWTQSANGAQGVSSDDLQVYGTESDGKVIAWRRANGQRAWTSERLMYRGLSGPVTLGNALAVGDSAGFVHFLSTGNGALMGRVSTDGSGLAATPVLAGDTLVVVTRNGAVLGFQPQ